MSAYRGTSLTRNRTPLGPYRRPMPRILEGVPRGGGIFLWVRFPCTVGFYEGAPPCAKECIRGPFGSPLGVFVNSIHFAPPLLLPFS